MSENNEPSIKSYETQDFPSLIQAAEWDVCQWMGEAPQTDKLEDQDYANAWYLFWENVVSPVGDWKTEAITPSKRHYFRGVWLWDSAFHALTLLNGGSQARKLARSQIDLFVSQPLEDGHLSREIWFDSINPGTQPPALLTWASLLLAQTDETFEKNLAEDYPTFKANHEWFYSNKDSDKDGLCEWEGTDSGWDTSPRWDNGAVEAVDLACWLVMDARLLAIMAGKLGLSEDQDQWTKEAEELAAKIRDEFWHEPEGMFFDLTIADNQPTFIVSPATFLPLFAGVASEDQAATVAAKLDDQALFATPFMLPTASPNSSVYEPENYWRGPVWVVTNAFAIWGLERYGLTKQATKLKEHTLSMIAAHETTYEYYNSQTGEGIGAPNFMWSAAFYILLQQNINVLW